MTTTEKIKKYDLEERTFQFAGKVRQLIKSFPKNSVEATDRDQLSRSSGSVAANYLEANEALSSKDFSMRIKICRKEAKESHMWLRLLKSQLGLNMQPEVDNLIDESMQLVRIFNTIAHKVQSN